MEGLAEPGVPQEPQKARVAVTGWDRITRTTRRGTGPGHIGLRLPVRMWDQKVQSSPWASVECWMRTELVIYLLSTYCVPSVVIASSIECLLCTRYRHIASLEHLLSWCLHFSWILGLQRYPFSHVPLLPLLPLPTQSPLPGIQASSCTPGLA